MTAVGVVGRGKLQELLANVNERRRFRPCFLRKLLKYIIKQIIFLHKNPK